MSLTLSPSPSQDPARRKHTASSSGAQADVRNPDRDAASEKAGVFILPGAHSPFLKISSLTSRLRPHRAAAPFPPLCLWNSPSGAPRVEQNTSLSYQSESKDSPFFIPAFVGPRLGAFLRAHPVSGFAFHGVQSVPLTATLTTDQALSCGLRLYTFKNRLKARKTSIELRKQRTTGTLTTVRWQIF